MKSPKPADKLCPSVRIRIANNRVLFVVKQGISKLQRGWIMSIDSVLRTEYEMRLSHSVRRINVCLRGKNRHHNERPLTRK